jgi:hypothetical protein
MTRRLVLHIGMPKCGSTSIQNTLLINRNELVKNCIYVPEFINFDNHWLLCAATKQDCDLSYFTNILKVFKCEEFHGIKRGLLEKLEGLKDKIEADSSSHTIVISSEFFYGKCQSLESIIKVREYLSGLFDEVCIIFVTKHPTLVLRSMYAQFVQGPNMGCIGFEEYVSVNNKKDFYNYDRQLSKWKTAFPEATVHVINLENLDKPRDLIIKFMGLVPQEKSLEIDLKQSTSNKSFNFNNLLLLSKFNKVKHSIAILKKIDFNNIFIKTIRNCIRLMPLGGRYPKYDDSEIDRAYGEFKEKYKVEIKVQD